MERDLLALRELRNDVSRVVARAGEGARFVVTVGGRPVAELGPIQTESRAWRPASVVATIRSRAPLDPGLRRDLDAVAGGAGGGRTGRAR